MTLFNDGEDRLRLKMSAVTDIRNSVKKYIGTDHPVIIAAQASGHFAEPKPHRTQGPAPTTAPQWGSPPKREQMG